MIFALLILAFLGAIVFFHYIQGFFSAMISAILTVVSAVVAFSYHESLVPLFAGHVQDYASGISLLALFAVVYLVLRVAFDKAVPGNVSVPVILDKAGAGVSGLIAGIFATGILAIAAQEMPFGPDVAGYSRFDVQAKRTVTVPTKGRAITSATWDELNTAPGKLGAPDEEHGVSIVPVDNIVVGLVQNLSSETGSLQNGKPLYKIHPDFLGELFGQRLGIEPSGGHTAMNLPGSHIEAMRVLGLYAIDPKVNEGDHELMRVRPNEAPLKDIRPGGNEMFLAVRVMFNQPAQDGDNIVRFSPASTRLLLHKNPQGNDPDDYENLFPVGTMWGTDKLMLNKVDDFLYCAQGKGADLVYKVPKTIAEKGMPDGSFIEFKRGARVDLSGMKVEAKLQAGSDIDVLRKIFILHPEENPDQPTPAAPAAKPQQPAATAQPAPSTPSGSTPAANPKLFKADTVTASNRLPVALGIPLPKSGDSQQVAGGYVKFDNGKIKNANMDAPESELKEAQKVSEFAVPGGSTMVQVSGTPAAGGAWLFATEPEQYEIVDSQGKHYAPNGVFAVYRAANVPHTRLVYVDSTSISGAAAPEQSPEAPTQVVFLYVVTTNVTITEFDDHGQKAKQVSVVTK